MVLLGCYAVCYGVTSQKTPFFIVTAVKTSNLTLWYLFSESSPANTGLLYNTHSWLPMHIQIVLLKKGGVNIRKIPPADMDSSDKVSIRHIRFEVFTAVTRKNAIFWDVTPCGSCKNRCFGGTWRRHIRMTISELGTTLAVTSKRCML
jgi:hypothetical protein